MSRFQWLAAAAAVLIASPALAQTAPAQSTPAQIDDNASRQDGVVVTGSRIVRQDFETFADVTTATDHRDAAGWTSDRDTTSSRTRGRASSVRVIRACEINLALGDEDCASK